MDRDRIIASLRAHAPELRAAGINGVSLFGSVARGDDEGSDVDLAVRLDPGRMTSLLDLAGSYVRFASLLGREVDVVEEPARRPALQAEIDRDRVRAF